MLECCALIGPAQPIIAGVLISVFSMIFIFSYNSESELKKKMKFRTIISEKNFHFWRHIDICSTLETQRENSSGKEKDSKPLLQKKWWKTWGNFDANVSASAEFS